MLMSSDGPWLTNPGLNSNSYWLHKARESRNSNTGLSKAECAQRGLDEELKVREEITTDINREVREARKQLMSAATELESLNERYLQARAKSDAAESRAQSLSGTLELKLREGDTKDGRIAELARQLEKTTSELSKLQNYLAGSPSGSEGAQDSDISGERAAQAHEIERLNNDNQRFESYADELRIKLHDQVVATKESTSMRQKLEFNLQIASDMINDLTRQLEAEKSSNQLLRESNETLRAEFEHEARQIRFELGSAQQTIADQESISQQLASDLIDNQGFRQALESHLGDVEESSSHTIQRLEKELKQALAQSGEYDSKLRVKDGAIADLMQELANQSSKLNFSGELESALQKIDGQRPAGVAEGRPANRLTRQLIGSADGKDLRFPLFRNRLSIGRTKHNDIQLDLRFVSRRHAVVATDNHATRIIDWGSRNGVYVNKKRITEQILKSGDVITIGLTNLRYEERSKR